MGDVPRPTAGELVLPAVHPLTQHEVREAETLLESLGGAHRGLPAAVSAWRLFTCRVERGFDGAYDQYLEGLAVREVLGTLSRHRNVTLGRWVDHVLVPVDARFREATLALPQMLPRVDHVSTGPESWWWSRIPRAFGSRFAADADVRVLVESLFAVAGGEASAPRARAAG